MASKIILLATVFLSLVGFQSFVEAQGPAQFAYQPSRADTAAAAAAAAAVPTRAAVGQGAMPQRLSLLGGLLSRLRGNSLLARLLSGGRILGGLGGGLSQGLGGGLSQGFGGGLSQGLGGGLGSLLGGGRSGGLSGGRSGELLDDSFDLFDMLDELEIFGGLGLSDRRRR